MLRNRIGCLACCALVGVLIAGCSNTDGHGRVREIGTANELQSKMDKENVVVIHALNREHYEKGHVPGAKNVDFESMTPEQLPPDKKQTLVFYCGSAHCPVGHNAADKAASWGYKDVWVYKGGIADWKASGKPVATGTQ